MWRGHPFDRACQSHGIEHRLTKPNHPWTNGQVERMNRTIKEATVQRYYYDSHDQFRRHLDEFVAAYNFGRRLKTLKGLTPYEFICKQSDSRAPKVQARTTPRNAGTKHLGTGRVLEEMKKMRHVVSTMY